jgi:hypothetical protein
LSFLWLLAQTYEPNNQARNQKNQKGAENHSSDVNSPPPPRSGFLEILVLVWRRMCVVVLLGRCDCHVVGRDWSIRKSTRRPGSYIIGHNIRVNKHRLGLDISRPGRLTDGIIRDGTHVVRWNRNHHLRKRGLCSFRLILFLICAQDGIEIETKRINSIVIISLIYILFLLHLFFLMSCEDLNDERREDINFKIYTLLC